MMDTQSVGGYGSTKVGAGSDPAPAQTSDPGGMRFWAHNPQTSPVHGLTDHPNGSPDSIRVTPSTQQPLPNTPTFTCHNNTTCASVAVL